MFGLNDGMRYYVCQRYVRMNMGINGLYKLVSQEMDLPPLSGAVFIFFSKNRQQVKLLRWDTDGFAEAADPMSGISFTFPDGTQVNIKHGSAQSVMSFLKLYQMEGLPCLD